MPARTHVVDSGGTSRLVSRAFVIDSGGTARRILRAFVIDSGGTARQIFQGDVVSLSNLNLNTLTITPTDATCSYSLNSTGSQTDSDGGNRNWITPTSNAGNYSARMTLNSGSAYTSGTVGAWLNLGTTRTWSLTESRNGVFSSSNSGTIEIRRDSDSVVVASATITMLAEVEV